MQKEPKENTIEAIGRATSTEKHLHFTFLNLAKCHNTLYFLRSLMCLLLLLHLNKQLHQLQIPNRS